MKNRIRVFVVLISIMMILTSCGGGQGAVADVSVSNIRTEASLANPEYGTLSFDFSDEAGDTYTCVMLGVGSIDSLNEESLNEIAQNLGGHFAGGSMARVDCPENCKFIDAEKYGGKTGNEYGDSQLCWAASVADMMVYAGWADTDEDEILSEFSEAYFDSGAFQDSGIKFYMNGVNTDQACEEEAGDDSSKDAVFASGKDDDFFATTQVRNPGTADGKIVNRGHATEYAAELVHEKMYASSAPESELAAAIVKAIDEGDAVGIQLLFYNDASRVGVHAVTAVGYVKDADGGLKALIMADSDNDLDWGKTYPDSVEATLADRQAAPDSYEMYLTGSFRHDENDTNYVLLKDYKYSNPKMKYTDAVIQGITVLKSKNASADIKESAGDAANYPDAVAATAKFSDLQTELEAAVGEKVEMPFLFCNASYKGFAAKDKPYVKCRYIFYKGGKKFDEQSFELQLVTDKYTTGEANCGISVQNPYAFSEAGTYTVDVELEGVFSGTDNHRIKEAFTGNNYLKNAGTVTVK